MHIDMIEGYKLFLCNSQKLTSEEVTICVEKAKKLKRGYIYHCKSVKGAEILFIPIRFNRHFALCGIHLCSTKGVIAGTIKKWYNYKLMFKWLRGTWTEVPIDMLPCYIGLPYKSILYEKILSGVSTVKFPVLSTRRKCLNISSEQLSDNTGLITR